MRESLRTAPGTSVGIAPKITSSRGRASCTAGMETFTSETLLTTSSKAKESISSARVLSIKASSKTISSMDSERTFLPMATIIKALLPTTCDKGRGFFNTSQPGKSMREIGSKTTNVVMGSFYTHMVINTKVIGLTTRKKVKGSSIFQMVLSTKANYSMTISMVMATWCIKMVIDTKVNLEMGLKKAKV